MFFAYEDRKQISPLIIETYHRISSALILDDNLATAELWEKTTAFMTESVNKNLKVEELVAETLQYNHKPYHLLCKSHVVEAFDHSNLDVLATVENQLKFHQKLIAINPTVNQFLCGSQYLVKTYCKPH